MVPDPKHLHLLPAGGIQLVQHDRVKPSSSLNEDALAVHHRSGLGMPLAVAHRDRSARELAATDQGGQRIVVR